MERRWWGGGLGAVDRGDTPRRATPAARGSREEEDAGYRHQRGLQRVKNEKEETERRVVNLSSIS